MIYPVTYLGPVSWYRSWLRDANAAIEQYETYTKQTIRNHCQIVGPNGIQTLTIPVERMHDNKIMTRNIRIINQNNWQHIHWQALRTAYRNSPFYDYYIDLFEPFYTKQYDFLFDFNIEIMQVVLKLLEIKKEIKLTDDFEADRQHFFTTQTDNTTIPYYQVFESRHGFMPDMSIIDLLFNMGPESYKIL